MKTTMRIVCCSVLVFCMVFCLSACGSTNTGDTEPTLAPIKQSQLGRYELKTVQYHDGTEWSKETLAAAEAAMGDMYVELFEDRTALLSLLGQVHDMEFSDNKMWHSGNTYSFSVGNGEVTLVNSDGDRYIFRK